LPLCLPIHYHLSVAENVAYLVSRGLRTKFIGKSILYYPSLPSTMDAARQAAQSGVAEGTVVIAGEQTAARGRLKRNWISPPGNIAVSIILYPDMASLPCLIMIASLSAVHAIETVAGVKAGIKWPNDVLIDGKKVCGILIENELKGDKVVFSIIGIGINTGLNVADHPEISNIAANLGDKSGDTLRIEIIKLLLGEFERLYLKLPGGKSIYEAWRSRLVTLGNRVKATSGTEVIEGIADSADESGALIIRRPDGSLTRLVAGDVTLQEKGRG
jgi:BirA family biotin operon repressor/biotin-[acetyl-CoA-carboxylase] ligase